MPTESGYSNTKKQGRAVFKTLHPLGSSRVGQHVVTKSLVERQAVAVPIAAVVANSTDTLIKLQVNGHSALVGDVVRFYSGTLQGAELEIVSVVDSNNFIIRNLLGLPAVNDTVKIMYYITPKSDAEGNLNFSPGPVTFARNNIIVTATEDTAVPSNNKGLPTLPTFYKDGVPVTVNEDTGTPANNRPFPVKLVGLTGDVNITAGDLNISTSALNDSMAIGDPVTNNKAKVALNSDATTYALKVKDDDANALLTTIDGDTSLLSDSTNLAGSAHVNRGIQVLGSDGTNNVRLKTNAAGELQVDVLSSPLPTNAATLTEQQTQTSHLNTIKTSVELIDDVINTDGNPSGTKGIAIGGVDGNGDFQQVNVNAAGELSVTFSSAAFATETTLSALNNKVANNYGAASGAIRTAAQLGNSVGSADFNSGADSAQTLRVSANLKRAGNELSYNSGASDANTLRTVLATRHEAAITPLSARLSSGTDFIGHIGVDAGIQILANSNADVIASAAYMLGWDGTNHREVRIDSTGKIVTTEAPLTASYSESLTITNSSAVTINAPAGAKWCKIQADDTNSVNLRVKIGGTATATSGMQFQPGRSEDYNAVGNISVIAESTATAQKLYVQWGA